MSDFDPQCWEDVCFAMVMECESEEEGFADPPAALVARYAKDYPHFANDLIDFAATCRTQRALLLKYPPREPTKKEMDAAVKRAMVVFRKALRNVRRREARKAALSASLPKETER